MCYDKESSAAAFVYATAIVGVLWWRNYPNDRFMAFFCFAIALIQAVEFVLWSNPRCSALNHRATNAAALIILAQPLVVLAGMTYYRNTRVPIKLLRRLVWIYAAIWVGAFVKLVIIDKGPRCTRGAPGKHLNWDYDLTATGSGESSAALWLVWLLPFFLFMAMRDQDYGVAVFSLLIVTLILSLGKGLAMDRADSSSWRSLYCFLGNSLPLAVLGIGYMKYGR